MSEALNPSTKRLRLHRVASPTRLFEKAFTGGESFFANFPGMLMVLDENWRTQYANPEAVRYFGKTADALWGTLIWEQWPGPVRTDVELAHKRAYRERIRWNSSIRRWGRFESSPMNTA